MAREGSLCYRFLVDWPRTHEGRQWAAMTRLPELPRSMQRIAGAE